MIAFVTPYTHPDNKPHIEKSSDSPLAHGGVLPFSNLADSKSPNSGFLERPKPNPSSNLEIEITLVYTVNLGSGQRRKGGEMTKADVVIIGAGVIGCSIAISSCSPKCFALRNARERFVKSGDLDKEMG